MAAEEVISDIPASKQKTPQWNYKPDVPLMISPLFVLPVKLSRILGWFWRSWFPLSEKLIIVLTAVVSWTYFQPPLEMAESFEFQWIALMWIRNLVLMICFAGGLHLYFYTFRFQNNERRYDSRHFGKGRPYTLGDQVLDNMFWTLVSGVTVWTGYEAFLIWGFANGHLEVMSWAQNPFWFAMIFFLMPIWESFYFYLIHRMLHWKPLYKLATSRFTIATQMSVRGRVCLCILLNTCCFLARF